MSVKLQKHISSHWDEIEQAREDTRIFMKSAGYSENITDAIIMVISELLENAVKYGVFTALNEGIDYSIEVHKEAIIVEVINPYDTVALNNFKKMDRIIQWIRGYQNPFQAYIEKLKEISGRSLEDRESGLGLVRIAYQGRSIVDFYLRNDNRISVSAVYQI